MRAVATFIIAFLTFGYAWGQSFVGEAPLPVVHQDGFYRIFISPEVATHVNTSFSNIRIFDEQAKEVPFLFQIEKPTYVTQEFKEYIILEKKHEEGCCTSLMLHNPEQHQLNNINLVIKNADVTKDATLLGSDDKQHWFALKQHFILDPTANANGTSEVKILDFPLSNYVYYSLRIDDSTSAPINILKAGYFEMATENGNYVEVPLRKLTKTDSTKQKKTYLHFQFDTLHIVDKLELSMKGAPFYLRKALLYERRERTLKKGVKEKYYNLLQEVELNSRHLASISLPGIKVDDLLLVVENDDNPPLDISFIKVYQINRYLTAFLKKDDRYKIGIGDDELLSPVYDLSFFKDSIPPNPKILEIGTVKLHAQSLMEPSFTFFTTKVFIWAAVVLVIVILGFMSLRLLKEAGSTEQNK